MNSANPRGRFPGLRTPLALLGLLLTTASGAKAPVLFDYTVINVPDALSTSVFGVNQAGEIVGSYADAQGTTHGFLGKVILKKTDDPLGGTHTLVDKTSAFTTLDPPGSFSTAVHGLNDRGQIVGEFGGNGGHHGFIYKDGAYTVIDPPSASASAAMAINGSGLIAGQFDDDNGTHGYTGTTQNFATLDVPQATNITLARGINDQGQVVGSFGDNAGQHGFLKDGTTFTTIDPPFSTTGNTATAAAASGINGKQQIVGFYLDNTGNQRAFFKDGSDYTAIDFPGAASTQAFAINDAGHIVGQFTDHAGAHGFLAVPIVDRVPDAYIVLLWALGAGLLLAGLAALVRRLRGRSGSTV